jgi:hypothetical protein
MTAGMDFSPADKDDLAHDVLVGLYGRLTAEDPDDYIIPRHPSRSDRDQIVKWIFSKIRKLRGVAMKKRKGEKERFVPLMDYLEQCWTLESRWENESSEKNPDDLRISEEKVRKK